MIQLLVASDVRPVKITPKIAGEAPPVDSVKVDSPTMPQQSLPAFSGIAELLTKPIDQQQPRALLSGRPKWFDFFRQADDRAIVAAITLSQEIALAVQKQ
jgi:hypothetical protein